MTNKWESIQVRRIILNFYEIYKLSFLIEDPNDDSNGPLSINIVNTNHLHLSGYKNKRKSGTQGNKNIKNEKKNNFHNIIKKIKPEKVKTKKVPVRRTPIQKTRQKKFKQDIKTTKPNKNTLKNSEIISNKVTPNTSKRDNSENQKHQPIMGDKNEAGKRSQSQPPILERSTIESILPDYVDKYAFATIKGMIPEKTDKQNQDIYFVTPNFANIKNNWFFGV